jgi:hypothetical protein
MFAIAPLTAHHAYPGFEVQRTDFTGRVEKLTIANPHTLIDIRTADGQLYRVIFLAASALGRVFPSGAQGMAERIHIGDTLAVNGRLKRLADIIEVCSAEFSDARGVAIYPVRRESPFTPPAFRP